MYVAVVQISPNNYPVAFAVNKNKLLKSWERGEELLKTIPAQVTNAL
ncbi:MAG: hypothetical protein GX892_12115 [Thermoanaerobacteraceae bacterium]|nr:hypothetical protein [Thermoanaerobacteraceae bacterium]